MAAVRGGRGGRAGQVSSPGVGEADATDTGALEMGSFPVCYRVGW